MPYTIHQITVLTGGRLLNAVAFDRPVEHLRIDSRRISFPESSLFFALRGARHDGHDYLPAVYARGVRNFVVSRPVDAGAFPEANLLLVDDPVTALQRLAAHHRGRFGLPVIGITGSNGKTIVKEWLFQLLHDDYYIVRSPGSYNSQVGVPLSVWQIRPEHELALFEAGISRMGEMVRLAPVIRCDLGLLTNLGTAHSEGFPSPEEKLRQKLELFRYAHLVICCVDDPRVAAGVAALGKPLFRWSRRGPADLRVTAVDSDGRRSTIAAEYRGLPLEITIPFADEASIENAIHCWCVLLHLGVDPAVIRERMARLEPVTMRLELKEAVNGCIVINDSYNNDLNALANALHFLEQQRPGGRRALVLSDILESGLPPDTLYDQVARLVRESGVRRFIGIGPQVAALRERLPAEIDAAFYPDTDALLNDLDLLAFRREVILLKGARPFAFERIARRLAQQVHLTTLEIDLDALVHNLRAYHRRLRPGVRMMVMVKASGYGGGGLEVARLLEFHQVDYLAVAYTDEGVELRQGGIQTPILVLNPEPAAYNELRRFGLEPELYSLAQLHELAGYGAGRQEPLAVHLKLDTGMHRLGFEAPALQGLLDALAQYNHLQVRSVFSHLAASEDPQHDAFTHEQARRFAALYEPVATALGYRPVRHLLNSSGIARFPEYQFEMVRLGIGLYGSDPDPAVAADLLPVFHLLARISQIKEVAPGETVGYGRRSPAGHARRIATITIGYADGLPRAAGNGRYAVLIRGRRAPLVGNVCMDMCMVDVTAIPEAREGDAVTVFGAEPTVEELAAAAETIPYEILTGISGRVRRVYVQV